jgi:uncharacterized protein (DUF302 family)
VTITISSYAYSVELPIPFAEAVERVKAALLAEGFGVMSEIDVAATLHAERGADIEPYAILGACDAHLVERALRIEPDIGLLLPCNVVVRASGTGSAVAVIDPISLLSITPNDAALPIA